MKKTRKQFLALLLALAMAFSLLPAPVWAAGSGGDGEGGNAELAEGSANAFDGVTAYVEPTTATAITESGTYLIWVNTANHWPHYISATQTAAAQMGGCGTAPSGHTATNPHTDSATDQFAPYGNLRHEWVVAPVEGVENGFTLKSVAAEKIGADPYVTVNTTGSAPALGFGAEADAAEFTITPATGNNYTFKWNNGAEGATDYYLKWSSGFVLDTAATTARLFKKTQNPIASIEGYTRVTTAENLVEGDYLVIAPGNDGNYYLLKPATWTSVPLDGQQLTMDVDHNVTGVGSASDNLSLADMHYTISGGGTGKKWFITHGEDLCYGPVSGHNLWHTRLDSCSNSADGVYITYTANDGGLFAIGANDNATSGVHLVLDPSNLKFTGTSQNLTTKIVNFLLFRKNADKTTLAEKIAAAEALQQADYTTVTWTALQTALTEANEANDNAYATQAAVDAAAAALETAIAGLEVDKSALTAAITAAQALNADTYTDTSWSEMQTKLTAAITMRDKTDATPDEVKAAATALQTAINALETKVTPTELTIPGYTQVEAMPEGGLADGYYLMVAAHEDESQAKSYYVLYPGATGSAPANTRTLVAGNNLMGTALSDGTNNNIPLTSAHNHITQVAAEGSDVTGQQYRITAIQAPEIVQTGSVSAVYEFAIDTDHELYHIRGTVGANDNVTITQDAGAKTFAFQGHSGQLFGLNSSQQFSCAAAADGLECSVMLFKYNGVEKAYLQQEVSVLTAENLQENRYTASTWTAYSNALSAANTVLNNANAAQADVDSALTALINARTSLAIHDPHALPGYTHKTDTNFSPTKRYLVVSWSSAGKPYALYFDNNTVGAGALPTSNPSTTTTNVAPITLTGADETLSMTFDKGTEAGAQLVFLPNDDGKYYVSNGGKYLSMDTHVYEEYAAAVSITAQSDSSFWIFGPPDNQNRSRYVSLNVYGDDACGNTWKVDGTAFWGPYNSTSIKFPVFIYESTADFGAAIPPMGTAISAQMMNTDPDNTWVFTGGRATEGTYEDVQLSRTAVSSFEEYVRWTQRGSGVPPRQRYVFNLGYDGQKLADVVSSFDTRIKDLKPKAVVYQVGPEDLTAYGPDIDTFKTNLGSFLDKALAVRNTDSATESTFAVVVKPYKTTTNSTTVTAINAAIDAVLAEKATDQATAAKIKVVDSSDFSGDSSHTYINEAGYPTAKGQLKLSYQFAKEVVGYTGNENAYPCANDYGGLYTTNWPGELQSGTAEAVDLDDTYAAARAAIKAKVENMSTPMTWMFMGDSITHGAAWSEGQDTISQLFEKFVKNDLGRDKDIVLNTAVSSANSDDVDDEGTRKYIEYRLNAYKPDVVSIMIGTNDAANHLVSVEKYKENLNAIVDAILAKGAVAILRTPIPNNNNGRGNYIHEYRDAMLEVANSLTPEEKAKVIVVDQFPEWVPYVMTSETGTGTTFLYNKVFTKNNLHPGPVGHLWMTQELIRDMGLWKTDSTICGLHYHDDAADWGITPATSNTDVSEFVNYDETTRVLTIPADSFNNGGTLISATVTVTAGEKEYTGTALRGENVTIDLSDAGNVTNVTLSVTSLVSVSASAGQKVTFTPLTDFDLTAGPAIPEVPEVPEGARKYAGGDEALLPPNHSEVTTNGQPFNIDQSTNLAGVAGSRCFRIPAMITLKHQTNESLNGRLVAAMDARWTHTSDAFGLDTLVAYSSNNGETWNHTYANYFADSKYVDNATTAMDPRRAAVFIDPVLAEGTDGTIYLMADLFPAGVATLGGNDWAKLVVPAQDSGYRAIKLDGVTKQRMILYTMTDGDYTGTYNPIRRQTDDNWTFFIGDFEGQEGGDKYAAIYTNRGKATELYVDEYYYLYKKASVDAAANPETDRIYCPQVLNTGDNVNSTDSYIQQNVFFYNSILHARCASYLWLVKSTDGGATWSKPDILNPQIRHDPAQDQFYGVGPGAGLTLTEGSLAGMVLLPTYIHGGTAGEISEFVYTRDNGKTWGRSQRATTGGNAWSSESCLVQIGDTTVRHFYRDGSNDLHYTDHTWNGSGWVAGTQQTVQDVDGSVVPKTSGNQLSAIKYSKKIDGKDAIILSTANSSGNTRQHGCLYVLLMDENGANMKRAYTYEVTPVGSGYAYSSLSETAEGDIALLYEDNVRGTPFKIIPIETVADGGVIGDSTAPVQQITVPLYGTRTVSLSAEALTALEAALADKSLAACTVSGGSAVLVGLESGSTTFTYEQDGKTVNAAFLVVGTANKEFVSLTLPDSAEKVVEGLPSDTAVDYNSNPTTAAAAAEQVTDGVSVTNGAKAKRYGTNAYDGTVVNLVDCLYTFTTTGTANEYYIQSLKVPTLFLNMGTAKRPNGTKEAITVEAVGSSDIVQIYTPGHYLYFGASAAVATVHFDRNGAYAAQCAFYLYRPAGAGETASTEIPGFVKLTSASQIESGKQYLIVSKQSSEYYALYPSSENSDFASGVLADASNKADQSIQWTVGTKLTITGAAKGTTTIIAGGRRYDVEVTDGRPAKTVSSVTITGTAKVGQTLTANVTLSDGETATDDLVTYQWYAVPADEEIVVAADTAIAGAAGSTYVPVEGDVGKRIQVTVTAKEDGGYDGYATSALTAPVVAADIAVTEHAVVTAAVANGTIAVSPASAAAGTEITVTLTPKAGCKVTAGSLKVCKTGDENTIVQVTDNKFIMPDYEVTVTAAFEPLTDLTAAKEAVEGAAYATTQASCPTEQAARDFIDSTITDALKALNLPVNVTHTVTVSAYTDPATGTAGNISGTDGSCTFTVTLTAEDGAKVTTDPLTLTVKATQYIPEGATMYPGGDERLLPLNHNEVTNGQPFNDDIVNDTDGVAGSKKFRIPAMVVLKHQKDTSKNGTIVTAMDARWSHGADAYGLDTMVAVSKDNGQTWSHTYANYFADSVYGGQPSRAAVFIDPVLAEGTDGTIYLMTDLFPGGVATLTAYGVTPAQDSGYRSIDLGGTSKMRMILYTMTDGDYTASSHTTTRHQTNENWTCFVGDFEGAGADKYATIYTKEGAATEYYVDEYYYLYKKASVNAEPDPNNDRIYCPQILSSAQNANSTTSYVQQNVFFYNAEMHVRCASYLWVVKSTDGGETWSKPIILNDQIRHDPAQDQFYGVGPGGGLTLEYGELAGMVLLPTYIHGGTAGEISEFIYTTDGVTWNRSQRATNRGAGTNSGGWSSESCLVQIGDTTVRHFYRDGSNALHYTDHTWNGSGWVAGEQKTVLDTEGIAAYKTTGNQLSAIRYSQKIDGKDAIILSTATGSGGNRQHGKLYVMLLADDDARTITKTYEYEVNGADDKYCYSSIAETKDGDIAVLYECADYGARTTFIIVPIGTVANGALIGEGNVTQRFDVPLYGTCTVTADAAMQTAMASALADQTVAGCTVNSNGTVTLAGLAPGQKEFTYIRDGKTVTITVVVEGAANSETVTLTLPDHPSKIVEGLPSDAALAYNSNPTAVDAVVEHVNGSVSVTGGAKAKRYGTSAYDGTVVNMVDCLYTFTSTGTANEYYIQSIKEPTLFLNTGTAAKRPNGTKEANMVQTVGSNGAFEIYTSGHYLHFGTSLHFDRTSGYVSSVCDFYLYRPTATGETASTEIPGFVKVTSANQIESGKQYLVVAQVSGSYYALYPSSANDDYASSVLVGAAATADQSLTWPISATLTITGRDNGTAVVMANGTRYDVTVTGGTTEVKTVDSVAITGTAKVGEHLTANVTLSDGKTAADEMVSYQWSTVTNGVETAIIGATSSTYTPVPTDVGKQIKVVVTAKSGGEYTGTAVSELTGAVQAYVGAYTVTAATDGNGTITMSSATAAEANRITADAGTEITITLTPDKGFKVKANSLKVFKEDDEAATVTVTDSKFTMPAYNVTVKAEFEALTDLSDAQTAVESAEYVVAQADCPDEAAAQATVRAAVNALGLPENVTADVTFDTYTAPVAGTAQDTDGTDGTYTFTVTLRAEDVDAVTTKTLTLTITATEFVAHTDLSSAKATVEGAQYVAAQADCPDEAAAQAAVRAAVNALGLPENVTADVTFDTYTAPVAGTSQDTDGTDGTYTFTVTLRAEDVDAVTTETLTLTITATGYTASTDLSSLKAVVENAAYIVAQADCPRETDARNFIRTAVDALQLPADVSTSVNYLEYTAPSAGTAGDVDGTNGTYTFTVTLSQDGTSVTTAVQTLIITATRYTAPAVDLSGAEATVENARYVAAQANCNSEAAAHAAIEAAVRALQLPEGVSASVNYGVYTAPVAGTVNDIYGSNGACVFTVTLTAADGTAVTTAPLTLTITPTAYTTPGIPVDPVDPVDPVYPDDPPYVPSNPGDNQPSGGTSKVETVNPDGSTTTTVTDKNSGTVTETTEKTDGSTVVVETKKDGTVTETTEKTDGTVEVVESRKDGTVTETVKKPDGSVTEAVTTPEGAVTTTAKTPDGIVVKVESEPEKEDMAVAVTIPETIPEAKVDIPAKIDYSTVALDAEGKIVKLSVPTAGLDAMQVKLGGSAELTLVKKPNSFEDITGHWAEETITFTAAHEFFNGTSETRFSPDADMTRGMMVTVLARLDGVDTTGGKTWYSKGVQWAAEKNISDGSKLEENITREQLATMLWRYAGCPEAEGELDFDDADEVSSYAVAAMRWAVEQGIFEGGGAGKLLPKSNASRAQVSTVLLRYCRFLVK